jgi:hypothetical protein
MAEVIMSTQDQETEAGSAITLKIEKGRDESGKLTQRCQHPQIQIGKSRVPAEIDGCTTELEVFTMALGEEEIFFLPAKTWSQLDKYKWRVQGKLPGTPPGLEVTIEGVKLAGESVSTADPQGCAKLSKVMNLWLTSEMQALEQVAQKNRALHEQSAPARPQEEEPMCFHVELDKSGQAHILCVEGKDKVANVACTVPGITSLLNEGLMRKPRSWKVGALRDWLELDGQLFRFNNGNNGVAELERVLNEQYHPAGEPGDDQHVKVFTNPASESGFDIEFPANDNGITEARRRHLDPHAMELLSDSQRCRVLRRGILVRFTPPTFHFKQKTNDGGERDLDAGPETTVVVVDNEGHKRWIDLSQPINHMGLGATELTAIFNHPSIYRRASPSRDEQSPGALHKAANRAQKWGY